MSKKNIYKIRGMHCASCAGIIEKTLKKTEGVIFAEVNYGTEAVNLSFDQTKINLENISEKIESLGYSLILDDNFKKEMPSKNLKKEELKNMKIKIITSIPFVVISVFLWLGEF